METIIGFAAGYLAGAAEGSGGVDRLRSSLRSIVNSPETRRLASESMKVAAAVLRQTSNRGIGGTTSGLADMLIRKVAAAQDGSPS